MRRRTRTAALLVVASATAALASIASAAEIEVSANVSPTLIGVGQFVTLTLEARVEGGLDLELESGFELENLEIAAGPSQSQQVSFVNGRVSRSQQLSWTLRAVAAGTARVQSVTLTVNDEVFDLAEQVIEVQQEPIESIDPVGRVRRFSDPFEDFFDPTWRRRRAAPQQEPKMFLRAEVSPRDPYVGEQVLYSLILFTQADIGSVSPEQMPDFGGLWTVEIEQPQRPKSVMTEIQGERYGRVVLLQRALFPLRPGEIRLQPVEASLIAKLPDYSWMGVVGSYDKEVRLASNAVTLDVKPLPESPASFSGAVGALELEANLEPQEVEAGEAATLKIRVSGAGHVDGLAPPELAPLEGLRIFPPQTSGGDRAVGTTVRGDKTWTYVLVPERADVWEIPVPDFSAFDPQVSAFVSSGGGSKVLVAKAEAIGSAIAPTSPERDPPPPAASEAAAASSQMEASEQGGGAVPRWAVGAAGAALLALLIPLAMKTRERLSATLHLRRQLRKATELDKPRSAAQSTEEAWRSFFLERWDIPQATAPGNWTRSLAERGVPEATLTELGELVNALHYLRYAPELAAQDSLRADVIDRSKRLARLLA